MNLKQDHKKIDSADMYSIIKNLPTQFEKAIEICKDFKSFGDTKPASYDLVIIGMGGSAIAGDILKDLFLYSNYKTKLKIYVSREYELPAFIDDKTYIAFSSYSGDTEETITAFNEALKKTKRIICISSGGELIKLAANNKLKYLKIPGELQPRAAIGYSLTALLFTIINSTLVPKTEAKKVLQAFNGAIANLKKLSDNLSILDDTNLAYNIAKILHNAFPLIVSGSRFSAVNLRWRGQIQENAKHSCFGAVLPEMNHNFINSFENPRSIVNKIAVVNFLSPLDNARIAHRFAANNELLKDRVDSITDITHSSDEYFAAMLELLYLGDWVSYYMAIIRGVDPTPIPMISKLKSIMSEKK